MIASNTIPTDPSKGGVQLSKKFPFSYSHYILFCIFIIIIFYVLSLYFILYFYSHHILFCIFIPNQKPGAVSFATWDPDQLTERLKCLTTVYWPASSESWSLLFNYCHGMTPAGSHQGSYLGKNLCCTIIFGYFMSVL